MGAVCEFKSKELLEPMFNNEIKLSKESMFRCYNYKHWLKIKTNMLIPGDRMASCS